MTEYETRRGGEEVAGGRHPRPADPPRRDRSTPEQGRLRFGGVLMSVIGAFGVIEGLIALTAPTMYATVDGTVQALDLVGWACIHLVTGVLVLGLGLYLGLGGRRSDRARGAGATVVALNALVQLAWMTAYPMWSIIMVVMDVLVLCALVTTSDTRGRGGRRQATDS